MTAAQQLADPRPTVVEGRIVGSLCLACGQTTASPVPHCPACLAAVAAADFGPEGTVWSATVLRIVVPGRPAPRVLAYVDLVEGPRLLAHVPGIDEAPAVGAKVRLAGMSGAGDPIVEVIS